MYVTSASPLCLPAGTPSRHRVVERNTGTLQGEEEKRGEEERNLGLGMLGQSLPLNLDALPDSHAKDCAVFYKGNTTHRQLHNYCHLSRKWAGMSVHTRPETTCVP